MIGLLPRPNKVGVEAFSVIREAMKANGNRRNRAGSLNARVWAFRSHSSPVRSDGYVHGRLVKYTDHATNSSNHSPMSENSIFSSALRRWGIRAPLGDSDSVYSLSLGGTCACEMRSIGQIE
jgi:hypothetical protein